MVYATIKFINPEYVVLVPDEDEDFDIFIKPEWLSTGIKEGDMVVLSFDLKPRKKKQGNVNYLPSFFEEYLKE